MTKSELLYKKITEHGENLKRLFPKCNQRDSVKLCKSLMRMETIAHQAATDWCNGEQRPGGLPPDEIGEAQARKAAALLGPCAVEGVRVVFNGDARGYALKLKIGEGITINDSLPPEVKIYKDWGGYGIIAPDFRED